MNITLIQVGKTDENFLREGIEGYFRRINHYVKFDVVTIPDIKASGKMARAEQKVREGGAILAHLSDSDLVVLLDEGGRELHSAGFADWLQKKMNSGLKRLCFVIGGPYGFSAEVYARGNELLALSKMTFSHQLVRLVFAEQLYRAFTIIRNEPYHHA